MDGLSPTTDKSKAVPVFGGTPSFDDILSGDVTRPYDIHGRGNWGLGEDQSKSYRETGDEFLRSKRWETEKAMQDALRKGPPKRVEEWVVEFEDGHSSAFGTRNEANDAAARSKQPYRRIFKRLASGQPDIIAKVMSSCVAVTSVEQSGEGGVGAGFCVAPNTFMTCAHVVQRYDKSTPGAQRASAAVSVRNGSRVAPATVMSLDFAKDIAVLRADLEVQPLRICDIKSVRVGDGVFAVGTPRGFENVVSDGILSAKNRSVFANPGAPRFVFTDAQITPGNSGGPLVAYDSMEVVGMVSIIVEATGGLPGLNAAISAEFLRDALQGVGAAG